MDRLATAAHCGPDRAYTVAAHQAAEEAADRSRLDPAKAGSADSRREIARLEDIPNVGPAVAADLRRLGITSPADLLGRDPYALYEDLCEKTGQRHGMIGTMAPPDSRRA